MTRTTNARTCKQKLTASSSLGYHHLTQGQVFLLPEIVSQMWIGIQYNLHVH